MARIKNEVFLDSSAIALSENSSSVNVEEFGMGSIVAIVTGNNQSNKTFDTGTMEVQTFTFPAKAAAANGDYIAFYDASGTPWAVALTKPVAEVQTLTVPNGAAEAASRDFVILTDGSGLTWATYFDTSGSDAAPSAAAYTAVSASRKIKTVITGLAANTDIVSAMTSALNGLTGFTSAITLSGTTTLIATMVVKAPCANPVIFAEDGIAAATNFSGAETTAGVAAQTPTGAVWTAIAAGNKCLADISGDTTAAQVAARVETAVDAMTGFTAVITTDDSAANGTMLFTQVVPGPTSNAVPKSFDDAGAGSITAANTTQGVATEVDLTNNRVYIPNHNYTTGAKVSGLTTTGTLPAGLATSTVYYIIKDTDYYVKFATSQANALAGTAVDITDYGATTSVNTIAIETSLAGSIKLQANIEPDSEDENWVDVSNEEVLNGDGSQSFSAAGNLRWVLPDITFSELRAVATVTSGTVDVEMRGYFKARL